MKPDWIKKIVALGVPLFLAAAAGVAQSGPPALPTGEIIGYWGFNDTNWLTVWNLPPRAFTNLASVPSWSGNALQIDDTNAASLFYNLVDTRDGGPVTNLSLASGSIEFWFAPNWDSGSGGGDWGRLFELGNFSDTNFTSAFGLYVSPDGTGLYVSGRTNNLTTNYLSASLSWNYGEWHYLIFTYDQTGTNTVLYLDGQVADSNNIPLILPAGPNPSTNWFALGADSTGMRQMHGIMDEVYTYNYALDPGTVAEYYAQLSPYVSPLPTHFGGGFHTMDSPPVLPGGGGSGGTTNVVEPWSPTNMFSPAFRLGIAPPGTNQWNSDSNSIVLIINSTTNTAEYQLWSTTNLMPPVNWTVEQTLIGNPATNWTAFVVSLAGRGPQTFFTAINFTQDTDGEGLPDWWQIKYFGSVGVDPYANPAGDGYSNLYKYLNGMNPNVFYQPAAPVGFTSILKTNGSITLSWSAVGNLPTPGAGALNGYTITGIDPYSSNTVTLPASMTNYVVNPSTNADIMNNLTDYFGIFMYAGETSPQSLTLRANFASGASQIVTNLSVFDPACSVNTFIVPGPSGESYLAASAIPPNVVAIRVFLGDSPYGFGWTDFPLDYNYQSGYYNFPNSFFYPPDNGYATFLGANYFDVPVGSLSNGVYQISVADLPLFGTYPFALAGVGINGDLGIPAPPTPNAITGDPPGIQFAIPFVDGRSNIQQNINLLLRGADNTLPFNVSVNGTPIFPNGTATNYVYSGFYFWSGGYPTPQRDEFKPFEDNSLYNYFVFRMTNYDASGNLTNGIDFGAVPVNVSYPKDVFAAYNYATANSAYPLPNIPAWTTTSNSQWITSPNGFLASSPSNGASTSPTLFSFPSTTRNVYGLTLQSLIYGANNTSYNLAYPGVLYSGDYPDVGAWPFYQNVAEPVLQTVGYYFARPGIDPLPGATNFSVTNVTASPIIVPFGQPFAIAAFAKQAVTNGYAGVFAYPQQYFDKALLADTNGNPTTNIAGILSEYGDFFAAQPGQVILTTKPDITTGATGQVTINVIKLQLDVNHDGTMDATFAGPDNTSATQPFAFWVNNNFDRPYYDADDSTYYDDDVIFGACPYVDAPTPDSEYRNFPNGDRVIPTIRDLQDFARLWLVGVNSSLLAALPTNSTVTLSWGDVGSPNTANPTIDLFTVADANGGLGYLTNSTTGTNQIDPATSPYIGRLGPGQSIQLNACEFGDCWRGNYFIWCGVSNGAGALTLTISEAETNILAQTVAHIKITDITQMYERWTSGDNFTNAPRSVPRLAQNGLPQGFGSFQYPPPVGTNTPYILYVHGWNMELWEKDRFAESAFKRLYWQGYQGRFGAFRWPTGGGFVGISTVATNPTEKDNFDSSEYNAWQSGAGMKYLLSSLNTTYSGRVYLLAHSMGNVVAGEALRLAGTNQIVNTYAASQAAISAHTYDATVPNYSFVYYYDLVPLSLVATTPNIYGNWFATNNGGGAAKAVSFYNTNDFALARGRWQLNQLLKPNYQVLEGDLFWDYFYKGATNDPAPWNHFMKVEHDTTYTNTFDIVGVLTNRYEVMAYAAQSYTTALGATPGVHNVSAAIDLTTLWPSPDPLANNYSSHFYHSAQFRGDTAQEWEYWQTLLTSPTTGFNIPTP